MYDLYYDNLTDDQILNWDRNITRNTSLIDCTEWIFDRSEFISTINSKVGALHFFLMINNSNILGKVACLHCVILKASYPMLCHSLKTLLTHAPSLYTLLFILTGARVHTHTHTHTHTRTHTCMHARTHTHTHLYNYI